MKIIEIDDKARQKIHNGINFAGNVVRSTFGPAGLNVLLGSKFFKPSITNDGLRAVKAIELEDVIENTAVRVMEAGMQAVNDLAGGARTATAILIQEIFNEGYVRFSQESGILKKPVDSQKIKREIQEACKLAVEEFKKARPIETLEDIEKVAFISVEDKDMAKIIAEVVYAVGKDGVVKVEEADEPGIVPHISEGMEIKSGYVSKDMATNDNRESVVENANILVLSEKLTNADKLQDTLSFLASQNIKDLVIFAPEFDQALIKAFNLDRVRGEFRILAVKIPPWDTGLYEDICTVSDSRNSSRLGKVSKIISNQEKTILIGGREDKSVAIKMLQAELEITKAPFEKQKLEERMARLSGKVALIEVGAITEIDRVRMKDKVEDGIHDTQGALQEGVLDGAGMAFKHIAEALPPNILTNPLKACYEQIQKNTGGLAISPDIIDSAKSLRLALESACNIAGNLLTVGTAIADKNEINTE